MKKIVYCISTLKKTGPTIVLYNIVKNLDLTKYQPIIITLSPEKNNSLIEDFQKLNIKIIQLNLSRIEGFFFGVFKLRKVIQKINPSVIHCNSFRDILLTGLFLSKKYKKVVTIHCDFAVDYALRYGFFIGKIMAFLQQFVLKIFDFRIAVSELLSNILNNKYIGMTFDYVDNGIDIAKFKPIENKTELRNKLNLPTDKKIFIWSGSFIDVKNPLILIKTIKQIENENIFFIFCGVRGYLFEVCKKELAHSKNVLFTGYVNNIEDYLKASDFYIATSLSEGLPNGVLEALSCGLPCILSNISQYKYILENTKNIGLFFDTRKIKDLENKISDILYIDYDLYSQNAVNLIEHKFSAKLMCKKYQEYYEQL